jgi:glycosyltransferase involved in cell wall biosynthesis
MTIPREVSVVIPTRNRATQTLEAVESALAQSHPPLEVIVIDDGSDDAVKFHLPRVRVLRHEVRRGAGAARNTGIDAAAGHWVAFLDSDDRWRSDKLERQFECLQGEDALCCCNVLLLRSPDDPGRAHNATPPSGDLSEWILIGGNTAQTSGLMLPTAAARRIRFDESLPGRQDWDFFLRAAATGLPISYVHDPLVFYDDSRRSDRISHGVEAADILDWIDSSAGGRLVSRRAREEVLCRQLVAPGLLVRPAAALWALVSAMVSGRLHPGLTLGWVSRALARRLRAQRSEVAS